MAGHRNFFRSSLMMGVGAAFDWFAGVKPRAPRAVQSLGLEWLHRVATEPRRLGPRYYSVVPAALRIFANELFRNPPHS
jgi:N-acetylglucosaminyldiphosphoundecaprenol N-acetyl-beta-D-mannosaminyltransferase